MKKLVVAFAIFGTTFLFAQSEQNGANGNGTISGAQGPSQANECTYPNCDTISPESNVLVTAVGQGVAPSSTISPAQAKALAKRAAIADGYRIMAEKVNGVRVEGRDTIRNMVAQRSEVRTCVQALIKNASVVESRFNDGLFEVEMELRVSGSQWYDRLAN